jgi:protein-disulfide isomerase
MKEPQKSSGIPLIIIGAVLVAAFIAAYWFYNSAKPKPVTNNNAGNTTNTAKTPTTSTSLGATPPNMLGSPTAAVTVEEFADFQCGACAQVHPTLKELQGIYGSRIRFIFRNFPLGIPQHDKAYDAAVAVEAAGMQDRNKFWAMQDQLFTNQQSWTANPNYRDMWADYAQKIGLDVERFKSDMAGKDTKARVDADLQRGRGMSINSTPSLFVNGKSIPLESIKIEGLRQMIDAEIQNAIKTQPSNTASVPAKPANASNTAPTNK